MNLWDIDRRQTVATIPYSRVRTVSWKPGGMALALSCDFGGVDVIDRLALTRVTVVKPIAYDALMCKDLEWSPDGQLLAVGGMGERTISTPRGVSVFRFKPALKELANLQHDSHVWGLAWSPDGSRLVSVDGKAIYVWRLRDRALEQKLVSRDEPFVVSWSAAGDRVAVGFESGAALVFRVDRGTGSKVTLRDGVDVTAWK